MSAATRELHPLKSSAFSRRTVTTTTGEHYRQPKFQEYFRSKRPPTLAVWGNSDPFFLPPGAEAFKRDNPGAEVRFFETGHFALETHSQEIADAIRDFLGRKLDGVDGRKK